METRKPPIVNPSVPKTTIRVEAEKLLDERKACRLFDIDIEEYGFCPKCTAEIGETFHQLMKAEFGDEIP